MNIGLLSILNNKLWDIRQDMAQTYADALKNAIELQLDNDIEKQHGYFLSKKGYRKEGRTVAANFEDKLYVGNIYRVERHLYYNDEELADDDQIINVVVVDGPVTRDGGGCSYGSKDWRDQVMYANTIDQVVGHLFLINTPGGEAACRNDYEMLINDCREKGKPTVAFVDGMCCSSGVNLASRCDRVIVMNPKDEFGCIGTMAAFWAVAHDTVDSDGYRYVELVGKDCPEKNAWWREAAKGEYEKLQADLDRDTESFHATVREGRPLVTDDMLSGKVFEAQEVIPALVDEIGDMERAIECVFALADETMQAARFMTVSDPDEKPEEAPADEPEESTHQINNDMTGEEKKVVNAETTAASEVTATATAQEPAAEPVQEPAEEPAGEPEAEPAQEPAAEPAQEPAEEPAAEPAAESEAEPAEEPATEPEGEPAAEPAQEPAQEPEQEPAGEPAEEPAAEPAAEPESEPAAQEAQEPVQAETGENQAALHSAEAMIADKDKKIAENAKTIESLAEQLDAARAELETAKGGIAEKDAEIGKLQKQVADLKAEVKELSGKPAPMVDAQAGVPDGNGTGEAPQPKQSRFRRGMNYKEYRQAAAGK